jgi:opacity protein-like surface antigen
MKVLKQKSILLLTAAIVVMLAWSVALADDDGPQQSTTGPTPPQAVMERDAQKAMEAPAPGGVQHVIPGAPEYNWRHGCGPTAVGMVVGYYDGQGYDDLIPGDASTQTAAVDQAIASRQLSKLPVGDTRRRQRC